MKRVKILWIDDYPSPGQVSAAKSLREKLGYDVRLAYLRPDGSLEGREWGGSTGSDVVGFDASICALKEALLEDRVVLYDPTLPSVRFFLKNFALFASARWICIMGHLSTEGIEKFSLKNISRKFLSIFATATSSGVLFYSTLSKSFCSINGFFPFKKPIAVGYGTPIVAYAHRDDLKIKVRGKKKVLLAGIWNARKRFDLVAQALGTLKDFNSNFEIHHVGKADPSTVLKFPHIKFHGYISDQQKLKALRINCHVSFLLSSREPWGHVVLENLATGLMTFTSKNCGSNDVNKRISEKFVLGNMGISDIVAAFEWFNVLGDKELLEMKQNGLRLAKEYAVEHYARALDSVISRMADAGGKG